MMSTVQFEMLEYQNQAPLPVWSGAFLLGCAFTLIWFAVLAGILLEGRPLEFVPQELELVVPQQVETPAPTVLPPIKSRPAPPKSAESKPSEPPRQLQPMVAPTANDSSPIPPPVLDPPPAPATSDVETTAAFAVETPSPAAPIKIEPLFRLTRLPDFGNASTLKYPAAEKNRGREGKVAAEFVIDEQGAVRDIKILKSAGTLFDQAVIDELSKLTFTPPYIGERAVAARFRREFQFKLD